MAQIAIPGGGGGAAASDECTATRDKVLPGYTAVTKDSNDEPIEGTLPIPRNSSSVTLTTADLRKVIAQDATSDAFWVIDNSDGTKRALIKIPHEGYYYSLDIVAVRAERMANAGGLTAAKLMKGQTAFGITGTATSDANATAGRIYNGYTAYVNGAKVTGTMTCNSILNFNAQAYSTSQILLQWQNPYAATGRPFSGVFINYSTGGYPGTGGTRIYTGYGNNAASGGWSQAIVSMPSAGTGYYFSCTAYCSCNAGDLWGNTIHAYAATTAHGSINFTYSQIWTVPAGVRVVDVCCVGGGSGGGGKGGSGRIYAGGGGGAGGYVNNWYGIGVTPGQNIGITVGAGGTGGYGGNLGQPKGGAGGQSSFGTYAAGGGQTQIDSRNGANGGSGGGEWGNNKHGGADGGNGVHTLYPDGSAGQGFSTRAFGGTLYAGGGGGGSTATAYIYRGDSATNYISYGGSGGGGNSGYQYRQTLSDNTTYVSPGNGSTNTGGGGGGTYDANGGRGANGGSGIVIVRW